MPTREDLVEQFAQIKAAPIPFVLMTIALAGGIFYLVNWAYSQEVAGLKATILARDGTIGNLNERVKLRDDQLAEKFKSTPPDEAKEIISKLQKRLDTLAPEKYRHLTDEQRRSLTSNIERLRASVAKGASIMLSTEAVGDAPSFAEEITKFLNKQAPGIIAGPFPGYCSETEHGISIDVADLSRPPNEAMTVFSVFKEAGLAPTYGQADQSLGTFGIFVCRQLP